MVKVLCEAGMELDKALPNLFDKAEGNLSADLHMDDVHACGTYDAVTTLIKTVSALLPVKKAEIHAPGDGVEYEFLKQKRTRYPGGTLIRSNEK